MGTVPPVANEREGLLTYLEHMRYVLRIAAHGLTDEQARTAATDSSLTVGGLVKHVTATERYWMKIVRGDPLPGFEEASAGYQDDFVMGPGETLDSLLSDYAEAAAETERTIAEIADLGRDVPVPRGVPWFPEDVDAWSVRWVLLGLIHETARHTGHADIVREHVDGATAFPLMAAVENWPDTPWMRKWTPAG